MASVIADKIAKKADQEANFLGSRTKVTDVRAAAERKVFVCYFK